MGIWLPSFLKHHHMKFIDILRSAGPRETKIRIGFAIFVILFYCCNPVKKVLDSNDKTQRVVDAWLQRNPVRADTSYVYSPGDTITHLLIGYDTTVVTDTFNRVDTIRIKERTVKLQLVHDTLTRTITDPRLLNECQRSNAELRAREVEAKSDADKWMVRFWACIGIVLAALGAIAFFKFKPSIKL